MSQATVDEPATGDFFTSTDSIPSGVGEKVRVANAIKPAAATPRASSDATAPAKIDFPPTIRATSEAPSMASDVISLHERRSIRDHSPRQHVSRDRDPRHSVPRDRSRSLSRASSPRRRGHRRTRDRSRSLSRGPRREHRRKSRDRRSRHRHRANLMSYDTATSSPSDSPSEESDLSSDEDRRGRRRHTSRRRERGQRRHCSRHREPTASVSKAEQAATEARYVRFCPVPKTPTLPSLPPYLVETARNYFTAHYKDSE